MHPRSNASSTGVLPLSAGVVDLQTRRLQTARGGTVMLTAREVALLARLAAAPGEVVTAETLLADVWGRRWSGEPSELGVVRNSVFKLRQKVERNLAAPEHVLTVQGEGYRFLPRDRGGSGPALPPDVLDPTPGPAALPPAGGPWDAAWDLGRLREERLGAEALAQPHRPLLLLGPWRVGKTWMLRRLLATLQPEDAVVRIEPRQLPQETLADLSQFVGVLALMIADAVGLGEEEAERALDGRGPVLLRLKRWMEREALPAARGRLVVAIEDLDRLARAPVFADLMVLLRSWVEEDRPGWSRLRVVFTSATSTARLTADLPSSPFNLGLTVGLDDLDGEALGALARRAGLGCEPAEIAALAGTTGGNPYLARLVLSAAVELGSLRLALEPGALAQALEPAREELAARLDARPTLREGLARVLSDPDATVGEPALGALIRLGLLRGDRPPYRARVPELASLLLR